MTITIKADPMNIEVDALALTRDLVDVWTEHAKTSMVAGRDPSGAALPLNKQGKPYGLGSGTIPKQWGTSPPRGTKAAAVASSWPFQEGGYVDAVIYLEAQGSSLVSVEGQADALINMVVNAHADRMVSK